MHARCVSLLAPLAHLLVFEKQRPKAKRLFLILVGVFNPHTHVFENSDLHSNNN
jgi:hypothetical protein